MLLVSVTEFLCHSDFADILKHRDFTLELTQPAVVVRNLTGARASRDQGGCVSYDKHTRKGMEKTPANSRPRTAVSRML